MTRFTKVRLRLLVFSGLFVALVVFGLSSLGAVNRVVAQLDTVPPASHLPLIYRQAPPEITTIVYIVQPGDTLFSIARRFGTTVSLLVELNNLADPNVIRVGQELLVPVTVTPTPTVTPTVTPTGTVTTTPTATVTPTVPATPVWTDPAVAIELLSPPASGLYHSPIEVIGFSQTFEGSVNLRLTAQDGAVLAERNTLGGSVDGFNFFHTYLRFTVTEPISATLEVFEISAKDGSEIHKVTRSLLLLPGQRVVDINTPRVGAVLCNPILVGGYSNTFEAVVSLALTERSGAVISQTIAMGGNLGVYSDFSALFDTPVAAPQPRLVSAYEEAASGQGPIDRTSIPVSLYPAGSGPCP